MNCLWYCNIGLDWITTYFLWNSDWITTLCHLFKQLLKTAVMLSRIFSAHYEILWFELPEYF
jgi:hypothetical protein